MKNYYFKHIKAFFISLISCIVVFSVVLCFTIQPSDSKTHLVTKQNFADAPYETSQKSLLLKTFELPVVFLLKLLPKTNSFYVSAIPFNSVKNSSFKFNECKSKEEISSFLDTKIDYVIEISNNSLSEIINFSNGIIAKTPYGVPSPVDDKLINDDDETAKLFSGSAIKILSMNNRPDTEYLKYQAYLMGLIVESFLKDISDEKYFLLKNSTNIDLSYADFYNNKENIKYCTTSHETEIYDGVWIENLYYLL